MPMQAPQQNVCCGFLIEGVEPRKLTRVPVVVADRIGRNKNIYPADELKKAVQFYKSLIKLDPTHRYMLAKHPKDTDEEWVGLIAGVVDDLYFDDQDNTLYADFTLLPTAWGHFIMWLLDNGYKVGLSIRGNATPEPIITELNGERVRAFLRKDLKLEGIDIVLYPSLITTHADGSNFEQVMESYVRTASEELNISSAVLEAALKNRRDDMSGEFKRTVPPADNDAAGVLQLKATIEELTKQKEIVAEELTKLDTKLREMQLRVEEESTLYSTLAEKRKVAEQRLSELEEAIEAKKKELDEITQAIASAQQELEKVEEAKRKVVVRFAGKTFSEDNPPKIRVVPVEEKVDESPWGQVYKLALRKLVWLTKDEKLAREVFGIVRSMDDYRDLLYPVYKPFKSKEKGYDIDLVLNLNGLKTALAFFFGRPGMSLSREEKKQLLKFLLKKYKELDKAGIHPVPESLLKAAKRFKVAEMFTAEDDFVDTVLEAALIHGLVEIEVDEDNVSEQAIKVDPESVLRGIADTILKALRGSLPEDFSGLLKVTEQAVSEDFIKRLLLKEDGSQTSFAKKYGITSVEEFKTEFLHRLNTLVEEGKIREILIVVRDMIIAYGETTLAEDQAAALATFIETVMNGILEFFPVEEEGPQEPATEPDAATAAPPDLGQNEPAAEPQQGEGDTAVQEKRKCKKKKKVQEGTDNPENTLEEDDEMIFEELKKLFEEQFEGVTIESPEQLIETAKDLCEQYSQLYGQVQAAELERVREQKISELVKAGVDESVAREELADVTDPDEIEQIASTLLKLASKVTEQRQSNFVPAGKGVSVVNKDNPKSADADLDTLLESI